MSEILFLIAIFISILFPGIILFKTKKLSVAVHTRKSIIILQLFVWVFSHYVFKSSFNLLIGLFLTSFFYVLVDSCDKYENRLKTDEPNRRMSNVFNTLFGFIIILFRWFQRCLIFISLTLFVDEVVNIKDGSEIVNGINSILAMSFLILFPFEWLEFLSQIKRKFIVFLMSVFIFIGLFNSKWWAGISLLVSLLGLAFSNDFVVSFLNKEVNDRKKSFYRFLIPYTTLIFYISLVFVQDVIPQSAIIFIFQLFSGNKNDVTKPGLASVALIKGFIELCCFSGLWFVLKNILKKSNFFNIDFFEELELLEGSLKSKIKEISSLK